MAAAALVGATKHLRTAQFAAEQLFPEFQEFGLGPDMMEMTTYDADEFYLRS